MRTTALILGALASMFVVGPIGPILIVMVWLVIKMTKLLDAQNKK
jgi:hypothetical protein